jgi:hypothetical protein
VAYFQKTTIVNISEGILTGNEIFYGDDAYLTENITVCGNHSCELFLRGAGAMSLKMMITSSTIGRLSNLSQHNPVASARRSSTFENSYELHVLTVRFIKTGLCCNIES